MKLSRIIKRNFYLFLLLIVVGIFFYKSFLYRQIPFPGDLIVGNYEPYKSLTYNGYPPGSVPHKAQGPDVAKELIPWKKFTIDSFKNLQIPFWNPYNFAGNPHLANYQSGIFYPFNILFFILNFEIAWSIYIMLQPLLAAIFTYLFLRRLNVSNITAAFGGLVFAFSSYMTVWMENGNIGHTFLWLPLVLYFSDKMIEQINLKAFTGLVLVSFAAILGGYIQGVFYIYLVALTYFVIKSLSEKKLNVISFIYYILGLFFPIALSAFQILPTLELFTESSRGNYTIDQIQKMLNPIYYLITIAAPDFFGNPATRNYFFEGTYIERVSYFGIIPFAFAVVAAISLFKRIEIKIFSILFLFTLIISTDFFINRFFYLLPIPVLSTTVATRILSITSFSGAVLSAFGLEYILQRKENRTGLYLAGIATFLLTILFVITFQLNQSVSMRNLILPVLNMFGLAILFFIFFKKRLKHIFICGVFVIVLLDLFYYFHKITPFAKSDYLYPTTPVVEFLKQNEGINRSWGYGSGYIESNFQTYHKIYTTEGNDPLHIKSYTELISSSLNGRVPDLLPRPDANIANGFGKDDLRNNLFRQKILNITGVKYILQKDESLSGDFNPDSQTFPDDTYKLVWQVNPWQVYENRKVTPRFFLTDKYVVAENKNRVLKTLFQPDFIEQDTLILLEDPYIEKGDLKGSAQLSDYAPNIVRIKTSANKESLLYLSDTNYSGWEAKIDGTKTKIFNANYAFRALKVPKGNHEVLFEYKPKSFYYGFYVSLLGLVSLLFISWFIRSKYG